MSRAVFDAETAAFDAAAPAVIADFIRA